MEVSKFIAIASTVLVLFGLGLMGATLYQTAKITPLGGPQEPTPDPCLVVTTDTVPDPDFASSSSRTTTTQSVSNICPPTSTDVVLSQLAQRWDACKSKLPPEKLAQIEAIKATYAGKFTVLQMSQKYQALNLLCP